MRYVALIGFALLLLCTQTLVSCRADKNKIVAVVADNGDQTAGRFLRHQFIFIRQGGDTTRSRIFTVSERDISLARNSDFLSFSDHPARICPAVCGVVRQNLDA